MIWRCDLVPQSLRFKKEFHSALDRVLDTGRYVLANEVDGFEKEFAAFIGVKFGVGVANATDGLILSLKALDVGPGDEVITTPFTAIPTVSAIVASGAKPVFVDIDPDTYLMDLAQVSSAVSQRTKAIMPVHIFGNVLDVEALRNVVGQSIPIIEDASQSHGATIRGRQSGSFGDLSVFSFYPTKNLGAIGDGGIVLANNEEMASKLKRLRMYGMIDKDHIVHHGVNSRLDELQAAFLRIKLPFLNEMNAARREISDFYRKSVSESILKPQKIDDGIVSNFHVYVARCLADRSRILEEMEARNIQVNIYYQVPLHLQKACEDLNYKPGSFPVTENLCREALALPLYPEMPSDHAMRVVETLNLFK